MDYITIQETAEKWGLKVRRVQVMCQEGKISGAKRFGRVWAVPADAERPADGRVKTGKYIKKKDGADQRDRRGGLCHIAHAAVSGEGR